MTLSVLFIVRIRVVSASGTRFDYRFRGIGEDYDAFREWFDECETSCQRDTMDRYVWSFLDPVNDAVIKLQWSEYFVGEESYVELYNGM